MSDFDHWAVRSLANLSLHHDVTFVDLDQIGIALRPYLPRYEEIWDSFPTGTERNDPLEQLPIYCFGCNRVRGMAIGGHMRDTCFMCYPDKNDMRGRDNILWTLFSITGYPIEVWQYILLSTVRDKT